MRQSSLRLIKVFRTTKALHSRAQGNGVQSPRWSAPLGPIRQSCRPLSRDGLNSQFAREEPTATSTTLYTPHLLFPVNLRNVGFKTTSNRICEFFKVFLVMKTHTFLLIWENKAHKAISIKQLELYTKKSFKQIENNIIFINRPSSQGIKTISFLIRFSICLVKLRMLNYLSTEKVVYKLLLPNSQSRKNVFSELFYRVILSRNRIMVYIDGDNYWSLYETPYFLKKLFANTSETQALPSYPNINLGLAEKTNYIYDEKCCHCVVNIKMNTSNKVNLLELVSIYRQAIADHYENTSDKAYKYVLSFHPRMTCLKKISIYAILSLKMRDLHISVKPNNAKIKYASVITMPSTLISELDIQSEILLLIPSSEKINESIIRRIEYYNQKYKNVKLISY
jgi:hypothetical protein